MKDAVHVYLAHLGGGEVEVSFFFSPFFSFFFDVGLSRFTHGRERGEGFLFVDLRVGGVVGGCLCVSNCSGWLAGWLVGERRRY